MVVIIKWCVFLTLLLQFKTLLKKKTYKKIIKNFSKSNDGKMGYKIQSLDKGYLVYAKQVIK